ncbi:Os02g0245900, partial [Oryza sativa Japonica Group]
PLIGVADDAQCCCFETHWRQRCGGCGRTRLSSTPPVAARPSWRSGSISG